VGLERTERATRQMPIVTVAAPQVALVNEKMIGNGSFGVVFQDSLCRLFKSAPRSHPH
jgi:hypothetical protein